MPRRSLLGMGLLIAALVVSLNSATTAEACKKCGHKSRHFGHSYGGGYGLQYGTPYGYGVGVPLAAPMAFPSAVPSAPMRAPLPEIAPPPGTLGRTYTVPTRPVPYDKHPRVSILEIQLPQGYGMDLLAQDARYEIVVTVRDVAGHFEPLDGYADDAGVWHFESDPLYPGIPHIYEARTELYQVDTVIEKSYGRTIERKIRKRLQLLEYRQVRLVMGRIVELNF